MKSKTSLFNKTIFAGNIKRVWPFWGLLSFGAVIHSLLILVERLRNNEFISTDALELKRLYYTFAAYGAPFIAFGTAIIAAMMVWSYLDSGRSVGFYHSIPISKTGLFVTQFASGLAIMFIPYVIGGAAFIITILLLGGGFPLATFVCIGAVIADSLFFFSFATLIAHLTGNILALPALYFVFNFVCLALENLLNFVGSSFYYGLSYEASSKTDFLTPIVKLLDTVNVRTQHTDWTPYTSDEYRLIGVTLENYHWIIIYAIVGVVFAVGALMIYKKRKSEAAGDIISTKCLKPVIHAIYVITVASLLGLLLYFIFNEGTIDCRVNIIVAIICFGVAAAIAYYTGLMLLEKTVKVFNRKAAKGLIASLAVVIVLCVIIKFDVFGVEKRIPDISNIESVEIISSNDFKIDAQKEPELAKKALDFHKMLIDSKELFLSNMMGRSGENLSMSYLTVRYNLKGGGTMTRHYSVYFREYSDRELYEKYKSFMCNKDLILSLMHYDDDYVIESGDISINWGQDERYPTGLGYTWIEISDAQRNMLFEAAKKDLEAGTWEPGFSEEDSVGNIYFNFSRLTEQSERRSYYDYDSLYVDVKPDMENCLKAIAEIMDKPYEEVLRDAKQYAKDIEFERKNNRYYDTEYYYYGD